MIKTKYRSDDSCNLLKMSEAVGCFNLSASTIEKLSKECGAKLKIGRSARYRKDKLEEYLKRFEV